MNTKTEKKESPVITEIHTPQTLAQGVIQVMREIKGIEKNMSVGSGNNAYKGIADKDVKKIVGDAMERAGLCILPIEIDPTVKVERWIEDTNYGPKQKQSIFTEVRTKYLLLHESGEQIEIVGYGHGIDSQDKAAGKATTYALKYALLYSFLIPTGSIDDADNTHSDEIKTPIQKKPELTEDQFTRACQAIDKGEYSPEELIKNYSLTEGQIKDLKNFKK